MKSDYTQAFILVIIILAAIIGWLVWSAKREIADAQAMFWASVSQPIFYISRTPFDDGVVAQAEEARLKLVEHGNKWLDPETHIQCWVYRSDISNPTGDFAIWDEIATKRKAEELESFRVKKTANSQTAAHVQFSQQRPSVN